MFPALTARRLISWIINLCESVSLHSDQLAKWHILGFTSEQGVLDMTLCWGVAWAQDTIGEIMAAVSVGLSLLADWTRPSCAPSHRLLEIRSHIIPLILSQKFMFAQIMLVILRPRLNSKSQSDQQWFNERITFYKLNAVGPFWRYYFQFSEWDNSAIYSSG